MKITFSLLIVVFFTAVYCEAQSHIQFDNLTFQQALIKAGKEHKPIFFMGYATWCPHCNNMKEHVFTDSTVANFYNENFICVSMDMEKGDGPELVKRFNFSGYPTFVFLDRNETTLYQISGEFGSADFINEGRNALTPEKQLPYLKKQFESNRSDSIKALQYMLAIQKAGLEVAEVSNAYLSTQTNNELLTLKNWEIINLSINNLQSKWFQFLVTHQVDFGAIVTQEAVQQTIYEKAAKILEPLVVHGDVTNYFLQRKIASVIHQYSIDSLIFSLDLMIYEKNNNWSEYRMAALQHTKDYVWGDYVQLKHIAYVFLKHVTDSSAFKIAGEWGKRCAEIQADYYNTLLYALLLEKSGDRYGSSLAAQKAKIIAIESNRNYSEAERLLWRLKN